MRPFPKAQKRKGTSRVEQGRPKHKSKIIKDSPEKLALWALKSNDDRKSEKCGLGGNSAALSKKANKKLSENVERLFKQ
ncbi:hypothetical protein AVEN_192307-1 [Araneus ventricosus]|uniref:Uncharacterized protein n=1 Tax=Araneus ventricosus TaxID=182803 RepID=A0A4Y2JNW5_ARAVE|nr:hypothetical protein AVEN_192307-1 [Araneus ventricosus]